MCGGQPLVVGGRRSVCDERRCGDDERTVNLACMAESLWSGLAIVAAVALLAVAGYLVVRRLAPGPRELGTEA